MRAYQRVERLPEGWKLDLPVSGQRVTGNEISGTRQEGLAVPDLRTPEP